MTHRLADHLPLEGDRIRLRALRDEDLDTLHRLANDEDVARWTRVPHPYSREHAARFLARATEHLHHDQEMHLAMADAETDEVVGMVALVNIDRESQNAELGYWVGAPARGKGIATEAVLLMLQIGFGPLDLEKVYAMVLEGNAGSVRLLENLGFLEEGRLRWHTKRDGVWMDKLWYALWRDRWTELQSVA